MAENLALKCNKKGSDGKKHPGKRPGNQLGWLFWLVGRYLQGRSRSHAGSSLWLVVLGIMIGVATLLAVLSGMTGLQSLLTDSIDELTAYHVQVLVRKQEDSRKIRSYLENQSTVQDSLINITRYRESPMLFNNKYGEPAVAIVRAVDVESFVADRGRQAVMQLMGPVLADDLKQANHMWVGRTFAYENGFSAGDFMQVVSGENRGGHLEARQYQFLISASYRLGNPNIEKNYIFIGLNDETRSLFYSNEYYLGLKLTQKSQAEKLKRQISFELGQMREDGAISEFQVRTGHEVNRAFFNALFTEKSFLQVLVSLIFLVVAFQIFQSTRRTVYVRVPELMLLRALGATPRELRCIFLLESLLVGLLGVGLGTILGIVLSKNMNEILLWVSELLFQMPALIPNIATGIVWQDAALVCGSALLFCSVSGWLATNRLLHVNIIEVLRSE